MELLVVGGIVLVVGLTFLIWSLVNLVRTWVKAYNHAKQHNLVRGVLYFVIGLGFLVLSAGGVIVLLMARMILQNA